jgi:SEC-C motif
VGPVKGTPQTGPSTTGRNDPCPCGSGRKYKHCCAPKDRALSFQNDFARARYRQGLALETQGRDDEAIESIASPLRWGGLPKR